jgi:zinc protease
MVERDKTMHGRAIFVGLLGAVLVLVSLTAPTAQDRSSAAGDLPTLNFEKYTLDNGLDVILSQDRRLPLVAVNIWYHVGPANEEPGRTGFAHLFEHLMFQGSKHTPPDSHFEMLEAAGATGINGTTDYDRTNYFETVPSNRLELALWIESDRMGYLLDTIDERAFANQQDVVRNERRQSTENRPYGMADEALVKLLYPEGHPYFGNVIGSHQDIQAAGLDDAKQFFKRYYAPNNASLAIVGDFEPAQVKLLVEKYFGTLKRGSPAPPISVSTPRITSERRRVVGDRVELPRVYMAWLTPPIFKPGDADAAMTAEVLGGGRASRLYKKLVYEKQIAQDVSVRQESLILGSQFRIQATARPGHTAEELETAIADELQQLTVRPPDAKEIERARNGIEVRLIQRLEALGGFGGVADRLNLYNHYLGTPDYLRKDIERHRAVTADSLVAFVRDQLQPSARAVVHAVPGTPNLGPQVPTPKAPQTTAGQGAESINTDEPWRNQVPTPGEARPLKIASPETATLANGLTLMLSPRTGLPIVTANLVLRAGGDSNPIETPGLAAFTVSMLDQGTSTRSAMQIAEEAAQLGATVTPTSSMDGTFVATRALKKNFPAALALAADIALRPSFPPEEIERQRAIRLGQLAQQRENPNALAGKVMASALYGSRHPYGYIELGTEASVTTLTRDAMMDFWKQTFTPNNAALVVAGDIRMEELRPLAEKVFGSWKAGTPVKKTLPSPPVTERRVVIVDRPGAPQTQLRVASVGAARSVPDYYALEVMNAAFGGLFSSRVNMNLREEHGYSYGAFSQFQFRRGPGPFQVAGAVRTDATGPAVSEIFKEIREVTSSPLRPDELQRARDSLTQSLPGDFETSARAAGSFAAVYLYDLGSDYFARYTERVNAVDAQGALAVARKYLVPERMVVVAVGDRAKIEPELSTLGLGRVEVLDSRGGPTQ